MTRDRVETDRVQTDRAEADRAEADRAPVTESRVSATQADYYDRRRLRERFGGIDTPAALGGLFAAIGMLVFLAAIIAVTTLPFQLNAIDPDGNPVALEAAGLAVATVIILVAFFVGGWAAARIARFDGVINGIGVALWMLLLIAVSAAAGLFIEAEFGFLQRAGLPDWFSQLRGDVTSLAVAGSILGVAAVFLGSLLGGARGEAYNRRVETAMSDGRGTYVEREVR